MRRPSTPDLSVVKGEKGYAEDFVCRSEGHPDPQIRWYKAAVTGHARHTPPVQYENTQSMKNGNRMESKLSSYDLREVMCCASNSLGQECSLLHNYDLDSSWPSPPIQAFTGRTLLLRCKSEDPTSTFDWYFNGSKAEHFSRLTGTGTGRFQYLYMNVSDSLAGAEFSCKGENNKVKTAKINVLEKGYITLLKLNEVNTIRANETSSFYFNATVDSLPLADCQWITPSGERLRCQGEENQGEGRSTYKLHHQEPGAYQLQLENRFTRVIKNMSLCVADKPALQLSVHGDSVNCVTSSPQPWNLTWKSCQQSPYDCQNSSLWEEWVPPGPPELSQSQQYCHDKIVSSMPSKDLQGHLLRCCLGNLVGKQCSEQIFIESRIIGQPIVSVNNNQQNSRFLLGVIAMLVMIVLLVTMSCLYFMRKKKPVYQSQLQMLQMVGPCDNDYIYIDFKDFKYDQKWEFPRENLELGKELGAGAFGRVVQATAYGITKPGVSMQVAVKMLKDKHQTVEREALMSELKMLSYIGPHVNIVNLLGACTCLSGPPYLIFQFCCNGDLLNYLKNNRERFHKCLTDAITKDRFTSLYHNFENKQNSDYQHPKSAYVSMYSAKDQESVALLHLSPPTDDISEAPVGSCHMEETLDELDDLQEDDDLKLLTFGDLLSFSYQVAKGMEFLSSKNCIHRDLAARNILVTQGRLLKIGDFGLARDIDNDSNYVVRGNVRLPVKWMAPESLFKGMYTMESDVWAYGILLWEIFSLGVTPYPGMKVDSHFYSLIERGFQMEQPYYASELVYQVMRRCWALEPRDRPCFSKLVVFMENALADMEEKIYLNVSEQNNNSSLYQNLTEVSEEPAGYQTVHSEGMTTERRAQSSDASDTENFNDSF
ncbi:hypothetical protein ACEWY4_018525 [Coilia grayii]|uniref:receptor protein-tyrosine kinase n=1 Tax=Coilia grayii TaxID=363190 RepID=A0ABD1JDH8_9TELE